MADKTVKTPSKPAQKPTPEKKGFVPPPPPQRRSPAQPKKG